MACRFVLLASLICFSAAPAGAEDPVRVSVEHVKRVRAGWTAVVAKIENLTDRRLSTVFITCNFSREGRVRSSNPGIIQNLGPKAIKYEEVRAEVDSPASVECSFNFHTP